MSNVPSPRDWHPPAPYVQSEHWTPLPPPPRITLGERVVRVLMRLASRRDNG